MTNQEIRAQARRNLGGHIFTNTWMWALLIALGIQIILSLASGTLVLVLLLAGPMAYAQANYFLGLEPRRRRRQQPLRDREWVYG